MASTNSRIPPTGSVALGKSVICWSHSFLLLENEDDKMTLFRGLLAGLNEVIEIMVPDLLSLRINTLLKYFVKC